MNINDAGVELIKSFEGLRLKAYKDPVGIWTIGYGHTGRDVTPSKVISEAQAEGILRADLVRFEVGVERALEGAPTTDNQFSAFVSLAFNIGLGDPDIDIPGFRTSTALRRHKAGNYRGASDAFLLWNKAGGRVLKGLIRRREAERALYLTP